MSVALPGEWGGTGLPPLVSAPLDEIWNGANMAFYVCPTLTQAAIQLLLAHGSEAQKRLYIPNLAAGDRKSVVSGKSVSVRVELGGRRIIKKKKQNTTR